jgi:S1-C subfamily serine protease
VNLKGEIIASTTLYFHQRRLPGVGFAIPVNNAKKGPPRLTKAKRYSTGGWGDGAGLKRKLPFTSASSDKKGVLVLAVLEGSPAQKAGIRSAT